MPERRGKELDHDGGVRRFVVIVSVTIASLIALAIIGSAIVLPFTSYGTPDEIKNWGGLIIGFYFGSFVGLLKDWLRPPGMQLDSVRSSVDSLRENGDTP